MASVTKQLNALPSNREIGALYVLIDDIRKDLVAIQTQLNTHVHSGVTTGASNSGAPSTTLASLNTTA